MELTVRYVVILQTSQSRGEVKIRIPDGIEHPIRSSQVDQNASDAKHQNKDGGQF